MISDGFEKIKKERLNKVRLLATALLVFLSTSSFANTSLFYVFSIDDSTKKELMLDQLYFDEFPAPVKNDRIFGSTTAINKFFSNSVDLSVDAPPSLCKDRPCNIQPISLLDSSFRLYLPKLFSEEDIYLKGKPVDFKSKEAPSILYSDNDTFLKNIIGPEALSIYRLSNFFGLATVADLTKHDIPPFRDCLDLLGKPFVCDNTNNGGYSITGNVMLGYLENCLSCSDSDVAILNMVSTHHLLRSKSKTDIDNGEALFSKNDGVFKDVGINYDSLKEIYLKSLTKK